LAGKKPDISTKPLTPEQEKVLSLPGRARQEMLNSLLFPGPTKDFEAVRENYGDVSVLPTKDYLYGLALGVETVIEMAPGVSLYASLENISEPDGHGMRTVTAALNGQLRPVSVRDNSVEAQVTRVEKADPANPHHIGAPFSGVVTLVVEVGQNLAEGAIVATIEAMKMEAAISTSVAGVVSRLAIPLTQQVEAGDLLLELL
jgi:pyruvate carboxylase